MQRIRSISTVFIAGLLAATGAVHAQEVISSLPIERITLPLGDGAAEIELRVYLPHDFDGSSSRPLLVILDADPLMGLVQTINFLFAEDGTADAPILVGLPFGSSAGSIWMNRTFYLLPDSIGVVPYYGAQLPLNNGGGAATLSTFLVDQVLPTVVDRYRVDRERIGLAGFSMGGLFAAWHLVNHPAAFSDYLLIAPPLSDPMVGPEFERATRETLAGGFDRPTRVYYSYAENDLELVLDAAPNWIRSWEGVDDPNLSWLAEMHPGLRHDSGAVPALISGYRFLYGR